MKKIFTIVVIVLVLLGAGYYLYKISPQEQQVSVSGYNDFDASNPPKITEPRAAGADDHVEGDINAKNTFVEYGDFQCPACQVAYLQVTQKIVSNLKDTKLVFRNFPLVTLHPNAGEAAYAAEAAGVQGKYWEMVDELYKNQADWAGLSDPLPKFAEYAQAIGLANVDEFKSDITSKKDKARIEEDIKEGVALNVQGTPTYYFNGKPLQNSDLPGIIAQAQALYK